MKKTGLDVRVKTKVKRILKNGDGSLNIILNDGSILQTDQCMIAWLRKPLLSGLGLENTTIKLGNGIEIDEHHKTSVDGIYVIGNATMTCG